jgi:hypothetical protein
MNVKNIDALLIVINIEIQTYGSTDHDSRSLRVGRPIQHTIGEACPKFFLEDAAEVSSDICKFLRLTITSPGGKGGESSKKADQKLPQPKV